MAKRLTIIFLVLAFIVAGTGTAFAGSLTRGTASLLIPGWGQYLNDELDTKEGKLKTGIMVVIEVGAIVATAVIGGVVGHPEIWIGLGVLIGNHVWSAADAYANAPAGPEVGMQEYTSER